MVSLKPKRTCFSISLRNSFSAQRGAVRGPSARSPDCCEMDHQNPSNPKPAPRWPTKVITGAYGRSTTDAEDLTTDERPRVSRPHLQSWHEFLGTPAGHSKWCGTENQILLVEAENQSSSYDDVESDEGSDTGSDDDDDSAEHLGLSEEVSQTTTRNSTTASHIVINSAFSGQTRGKLVDMFFKALKMDELPHNALERWNCFMATFSDSDDRPGQAGTVTLEDRDYTRKRFRDYADYDRLSHSLDASQLFSILKQPVGGPLVIHSTNICETPC